MKFTFNKNIIFVLLLLLLPLIIKSPYFRYLIILSMIYAIVVSNWDLTIGYLGNFNFAHIAFFLLGAYGAGVASTQFGINSWLGIIIGALIAMFASIIISLPMLRVKGYYVILVTFAFSELCKHIIMSMRGLTGGSMGLVLIPDLKIGGYSLASNGEIGYYYLVLLSLVLSTVYLRKIVNSDFGKSIIALRNFEDYAKSRGISYGYQLIKTFIASAVFTGAGGAIFSYFMGAISPELFGFGFIATMLSMVLLGGTGTIYGPIIGAFILTLISEYMIKLGPWRFLIIAIIIIIVLRFYPEGIWSIKNKYKIKSSS